MREVVAVASGARQGGDPQESEQFAAAGRDEFAAGGGSRGGAGAGDGQDGGGVRRRIQFFLGTRAASWVTVRRPMAVSTRRDKSASDHY
ncbi:hypothetical protein [Streptomyces sp. NPDC048527]|uniref:hypothetical protein n=1 Tax=Streptomyces sp. NPDC048527 TaxID=3365568 RepID=UPI003710120E